MADNDGIRTPNLPLGSLIEVLGHEDAGNGLPGRVARMKIEELVQYLLGLAGLDPSEVLDLTQRLATETTNRVAADILIRRIQDAYSDTITPEPQSARAASRFHHSATVGTAVLADPTVMLGFIGMGQSNQEGGQPTSPNPISTSVLYPGRAFMPSTGPRFFDGFKDGSQQRLDFNRFHELVGAREFREASGLSESPLAGFLNHFVKLMDNAFPGTPKCKVGGFISARGGTPIANLKEGSATFRQAINGVVDMHEAARRMGLRLVVPGVLWNQGESDVNNPAYGEWMLELLRRALSAAIRAITGQTEEVMLFLAQTNAVSSGLPATYQRVQLRQIRAAQMYPYIRCVGPIYPWPMEETSNVSSSQVHKSSVGVNRTGMMFARGVFREICGMGCAPFAPTSAYFISATTLRVEFDVPVQPIVLDTSGTTISTTGIPGYFGFDVMKGGATLAPTDANFAASLIPISGHSIYAPTIIEFGLSAAPTTRQVTLAYGMRRNDTNPNTPDGPKTGARGCLRDSEAHVSLMDGVSNANWCLQFALPVQTY